MVVRPRIAAGAFGKNTLNKSLQGDSLAVESVATNQAGWEIAVFGNSGESAALVSSPMGHSSRVKLGAILPASRF
jgi:hypothetical protein